MSDSLEPFMSLAGPDADMEKIGESLNALIRRAAATELRSLLGEIRGEVDSIKKSGTQVEEIIHRRLGELES